MKKEKEPYEEVMRLVDIPLLIENSTSESLFKGIRYWQKERGYSPAGAFAAMLLTHAKDGLTNIQHATHIRTAEGAFIPPEVLYKKMAESRYFRDFCLNNAARVFGAMLVGLEEGLVNGKIDMETVAAAYNEHDALRIAAWHPQDHKRFVEFSIGIEKARLLANKDSSLTTFLLTPDFLPKEFGEFYMQTVFSPAGLGSLMEIFRQCAGPAVTRALAVTQEMSVDSKRRREQTIAKADTIIRNIDRFLASLPDRSEEKAQLESLWSTPAPKGSDHSFSKWEHDKLRRHFEETSPID